MYDNLSFELRRKNIPVSAVAKILGCTEKTVWNKLKGESDFTVSEATTICNDILPEFSFSYLFSRSA